MAQFQEKGKLVLVDAVRLPSDARLPVKSGWEDAKRGDWLVTDSDNDQYVYGPVEFAERYTPADAEAQRLVMGPESDEAV